MPACTAQRSLCNVCDLWPAAPQVCGAIAALCDQHLLLAAAPKEGQVDDASGHRVQPARNRTNTRRTPRCLGKTPARGCSAPAPTHLRTVFGRMSPRLQTRTSPCASLQEVL